MFVAAESNAELLERLPRVLQTMSDVFTKHFLALNWKPGKTLIVLRLCGPGTQRDLETLRRPMEDLASAGPDASPFAVRTASGLCCNVVPSYKHVGSMVSAKASLEPELRRRLQIASAVYYPLVRKLFGSRAVTVTVKLSLFMSLVMSTLLYGAETWPDLTPAQGRRLEAFYMRAIRRITGVYRAPAPDVQRESDAALRQRMGIESVHSIIRRRRLAYARGLLAVPQPAVASLLKAHGATPPPGLSSSYVTSKPWR